MKIIKLIPLVVIRFLFTFEKTVPFGFHVLVKVNQFSGQLRGILSPVGFLLSEIAFPVGFLLSDIAFPVGFLLSDIAFPLGVQCGDFKSPAGFRLREIPF